MLHSLILAAALTNSPALVVPPADVGANEEHRPVVRNKKLIGALRKWLKEYLKGKITVGNVYQNIAGKSLGKKAGVLSKDMFPEDRGALKPGEYNYRDEIEKMLELAGRSPSKAMAQMLLQYAALGLDDHYNYSPGMISFFIRKSATSSLREMAGDVDAQAWLEACAKGEIKGVKVHKKVLPALQAAAVVAVGAINLRANADMVLGGLKSPSLVVRVQAADVLSASADPKLLEPLVAALEAEKEEFGRQFLHASIRKLIRGCRFKVDQKVAQRAIKHLLDELGKPSGWHYKTQLAELVSFYPRAEFVPAMIDLLERFVTRPEEVASGQLTGVLRHRAYDSLTRLTNAFYPMDDIKEWRAYWEREKDNFKPAIQNMRPELLKKKWEEEEAKRRAGSGAAEATAEKRSPTVGMSNGKFFGIPVRGSNVVFIVDVGQDMKDPLRIVDQKNQGRWKNGIKRIDAMKEEVAKVIAGLTPDTQFNVVAFSETAKAAFKKASPASKRNKNAGTKFAKKQSPAGSYNLTDPLVLALDCGRLWYGVPGNGVDEVFIVSNRAIRLGAITLPDDIRRLIQDITAYSKVRINTVYIGAVNDPKDKNQAGKATMENLANLTQGTFIRP